MLNSWCANYHDQRRCAFELLSEKRKKYVWISFKILWNENCDMPSVPASWLLFKIHLLANSRRNVFFCLAKLSITAYLAINLYLYLSVFFDAVRFGPPGSRFFFFLNQPLRFNLSMLSIILRVHYKIIKKDFFHWFVSTYNIEKLRGIGYW